MGEPVEIGTSAAQITWIADRRLLSVEKVGVDDMRGTFVDLAKFPVVTVTDAFSLDRTCHQFEMHAQSIHVVMACSKKGELQRSLWIWDPSRPAPIEAFTAQSSLSLFEHGWSPSAQSFAFHAGTDAHPSPHALHEVEILSGGIEPVDDDVRQWPKAGTNWVEPWNADGSAYFFTRKDGTLKARRPAESKLFTLAGGSGLEAFGTAWQRAGYQ